MVHPEILRGSRIMLLYTSCSSFQGHLQRIPTFRFTGSLRMSRYSNIAVPKPLELSNYCSVINTQSRWLLTARQVGRHWKLIHMYFFQIFLLCTRKQTYTYLNALLLAKQKQQKTTKNKICGFRRFHGLLIHNLVTPKNMEKSSQILETNPSRFKLCGSFYSSGQNWYAIHLVKETAVVRFELFWAKTKHYFFWIVHFTSFHCFMT